MKKMYAPMNTRPLAPMLLLVVLAAAIQGCATSTTGGTQTGSTAVPTADTDLVRHDPSYRIPTYPFARAYMTVQGSPGGQVWPNNGEMRIYAFSWGGERPLAVPQIADTVGDPIVLPGGIPALNVQKRVDEFSPLFQELFTQKIDIDAMTFTVERETAEATTYHLFDVQVAAVRPVGPQNSTIPASEEIVLVFGRITRE